MPRRARSGPRPADGAEPARDDDRNLESAFLDEYVRRSDDIEPDVLAARVAAYRTVALARLAVRSWCQLKPYRLRPVMTLLDQPPRIRSRVP